ncbi:Olfactory receptor 10 [Lemmus lemmus]
MGNSNSTSQVSFILVGFSDWPQLQGFLFVFILIFYSLTVFGNTTIITLARLDVRLHTPMYFFLSNLSFLDLCVAQLYIFLALGSTECVLLVVMAFDRYAAVCRPLHYTTIMHPVLCQSLAIASWVGGFINSLIQHFFCEMPVLLKLACEDTGGTEAKMFVARVVIVAVPAMLILGSYAQIARAVLKVKSMAGRRKAFGTCGSHLVVVSLFYGSAIYTYLQPKGNYSESEGKFVALFYTIITPMLNPLIYTLRNKDVKGALRKALGRSTDSE